MLECVFRRRLAKQYARISALSCRFVCSALVFWTQNHVSCCYSITPYRFSVVTCYIVDVCSLWSIKFCCCRITCRISFRRTVLCSSLCDEISPLPLIRLPRRVPFLAACLDARQFAIAEPRRVIIILSFRFGVVCEVSCYCPFWGVIFFCFSGCFAVIIYSGTSIIRGNTR